MDTFDKVQIIQMMASGVLGTLLAAHATGIPACSLLSSGSYPVDGVLGQKSSSPVYCDKLLQVSVSKRLLKWSQCDCECGNSLLPSDAGRSGW